MSFKTIEIANITIGFSYFNIFFLNNRRIQFLTHAKKQKNSKFSMLPTIQARFINNDITFYI